MGFRQPRQCVGAVIYSLVLSVSPAFVRQILTECLPSADTVVSKEGTTVSKTQFLPLGSCHTGVGRQTVNKTNHTS